MLFKSEDFVQGAISAMSRTIRAASHATAHWFSTMMVAQRPPSSRFDGSHRRDAGVYSRQNTSSGAACAGVRAAVRAAVGAEEDQQGGHHALLCHKAGDKSGGDAPVRKAQRANSGGDIARNARQNAGLRVSSQRQMQVKVLQEPDDDGGTKDDCKGSLQEVPRLFPTAAAPRFFRPGRR